MSARLRAKFANIGLSFIRAFAAAASLGQIPGDTRGAQAILMAALFAGGAAALRTVQALLEEAAAPADTNGGE